MESTTRKVRKLAEILHDQLDYALEKVDEGILAVNGQSAMGHVGLASVSRALDEIEAYIGEHGTDGQFEYSLKPPTSDARFAVARITTFLGDEVSKRDDRDGRAYLEFLRCKVVQLKEIAAQTAD
jgi:hypothetical protein